MNEQTVGLETEYLFPQWAPLGEHGGETALTGILREWRDFVLLGVLVYWGVLEICKRRFWKREDLSIKAPLGNLEEISFTVDSERHSHIDCRSPAIPCR
jgi:hypothetical protein